jgi:acetoin utilization protein AcuB
MSNIVILVRDVMTRALVTVGRHDSCAEARRLMDEHRIRHLPVLEDGRLVGIVSDRDLRAVPAGALAVAVDRVMTRSPVAVAPPTRIEHAARLMLDGRIGALVVVEREAVVGIVSYVDVLRAFVQVIETATEERIAVDVVAAA